MEFLVHIEVRWPADGDEARKAELVALEAERARELRDAGTLRRLWRVPGRWANVGVWEAADATELHAAVSSLPFFPWLEVDVSPLAEHPSDPGLGRA
ncbi:MAG: muconolactone Delta-isomerase family protein [Euzebyaceae bacterium]|nr:muconolactone Delta-isomerase family protein [Euzebyaceae bacterium]